MARNSVNKGLFYLIFSKVRNIWPYFSVVVNSVIGNFSIHKKRSWNKKAIFSKFLKDRYFLLGGFEDIIFGLCLNI